MIWPVSCAIPNRTPGEPKLHGRIDGIRITSGTLLHRVYGRDDIEEGFFCNYEVNPKYEKRFEETGLKISARGTNGEIRAVEAPAHPFFVATLFQPQLASTPELAHPIVVAFARAAADKIHIAAITSPQRKPGQHGAPG